MKHTKFRFATVLLAMWLLFTAIPITVFAELLQLHTEPISNDTVYVLAEDNTKRTAFEKHYYCSNGTFVAVTYPEAVHYQNEQGDWVDVDLRMTDDRVAQAYRSQSGSFKTSFSKPGVRSDTSIMSDGVTTSNAPAVSIESGDYALSWSLVGEQHAKTSVSTYASNGGSAYLSASEQATVQVVGELKTAAPAAAVQKLPITDPGAFELSSVANQVVYENIFGRDQNVSVRYSVSLNKIEEDIMITAPTDMTSFSMQVACGSLTPTLNDDNSVDFLDNDGNMVYHVSIPYLVDSACAVSYAVDVTLTVQGESCIITYTPDAAWMQDPARVYPIMLDPAVTTRDYASAISDTYVASTSQACHLNEQYLRISQDDGAKRVALLKLNHLPSIAENLPIISATLNTCSLMALNHSVVIDVKLEELASDLNLLMVKYNDLNGIGKTEIDRVSLSSTSAVTTFDITSCINNLYSGQSSGCFAISLVGNGYLLSIPPIYSTEQAVVSLRPYVSVTYGYVLPENLSANDSIQLKNLSSGGFLFPNSGLCGAGNYIMHAPNSAALNLRTFNLRVNTVSGAYKLELSPNSDTSNVFVSADLSSELVLLKNASDASANIMQDWLIVPYDATTFKIVLASDMRYVMTAVGSATPYAATPSTSTSGCVSITQCNGAPTNAQLWKIFKGGQAVTNSMALPSLLLDSGIYYVNNRKTGAFISRNLTSSSVTMTSGLLEDIKDQIEWKITRLPDGYYTIQSTQHPNKFLTAQSESAIMATCTGEIEDAQKWHISGSDSQCFFKSALNDKYLYPSSDAATSSQYDLQIGYLNLASEWRIATPEDYGEHVKNVAFNDLALNISIGEEKKPIISNESIWNSYKDFIYYVENDANVTYNTDTETFIGKNTGTATINVIHKVTGDTASFDIVVYRPAVVLIHGRIDNSFTIWGANNHVVVNPFNTDAKGNNHYNSSLNAATTGSFNALYTAYSTQELYSYTAYQDEYGNEDNNHYENLVIDAVFNGKYTGNAESPYLEQHPEGGNLAYYLTQNGYTINIDLFVFNYPNQDAVIHNAYKLDAYLTNLAAHICTSGSTQAKLSFFGTSSGISDTTPYNIDIVGHSMGGLVARYYIENIGKDENIRKLITIDTPHWGSSLAGISVWPLHYLCDHDLKPTSNMFGGNSNVVLDFCIQCQASTYTLTDELNYNADRSTEYYAIAGIDLPSSWLEQNDFGVNINPNYSTTTEISDTIQNSHSQINEIDIYEETDNIVEFLSQIGCDATVTDGVKKKINFKEIFVNIDTNGENSVIDHLHSKMAHRVFVMNKIFDMLNDEN